MNEAEQSRNKLHIIDLTKVPVEEVCDLHDQTLEQTLQQTGTTIKIGVQQVKRRFLSGASADEITGLLNRVLETVEHNNRLILNLRDVIIHPESAPINPQWRNDPSATEALNHRDVYWLGEIPNEIQPEDC
ncbi:MAG: hypothetical protein WCV81_05155 [Microgenomates group bacterium]